jgi:NADP-dependent 3-hydroxy acid dehydrogenase YdfG
VSKVWLITGASRGLGRAFTEAVVEAGDRVVATARNPEQLAELKDRYSEKVCTVPLDVTNEVQAKAAFKAAIASFGSLDVLVNNAGYAHVRPVEDTLLDDFRAQIETNLFGVIIMSKAVLPYFRERKAGHIIQVTSIAGRIGPAGRAPYAAAKFGVEGFRSHCPRKSGRSVSRSRSLNLEAFVQTLPGPQLDLVKAALTMTPPLVRLFAFRKPIMGHSRGSGEGSSGASPRCLAL